MKSNFEVFVTSLGKMLLLLMIIRMVSALVDIAAALQQIAASMP